MVWRPISNQLWRHHLLRDGPRSPEERLAPPTGLQGGAPNELAAVLPGRHQPKRGAGLRVLHHLQLLVRVIQLLSPAQRGSDHRPGIASSGCAAERGLLWIEWDDLQLRFLSVLIYPIFEQDKVLLTCVHILVELEVSFGGDLDRDGPGVLDENAVLQNPDHALIRARVLDTHTLHQELQQFPVLCVHHPLMTDLAGVCWPGDPGGGWDLAAQLLVLRVVVGDAPHVPQVPAASSYPPPKKLIKYYR